MDLFKWCQSFKLCYKTTLKVYLPIIFKLTLIKILFIFHTFANLKGYYLIYPFVLIIEYLNL